MTGPHQNPVLDIGEPPCTSGDIVCPLFEHCMESQKECAAFRAWSRNHEWADENIGTDLQPRRNHASEL